MNKLQELIHKLENCECYFDELGKIRSKIYKFSKDGKEIGLFTSYKSIGEEIGVSETTVFNFVKGKYTEINDKGYEIIKIDTTPYKKIERYNGKILIAEKDGVYQSFKSKEEACKELGISKNVIGNVISGLIEGKDGYFFYWDN